MKTVAIIGSGNAALCAGIACLEKGASVIMIEKAQKEEAHGNSRYTAGAMRFSYNSNNDLFKLLADQNEPRLINTEFGSYSKDKFEQDLYQFNEGRPITKHQRILIDNSYNAVEWLSKHNIKFEPIYNRQSFQKDGKHIFWGGLTLAAFNEGPGLVEAETKEFLNLGGQLKYGLECTDILFDFDKVQGVIVKDKDQSLSEIKADAVILGCGGFEASPKLREEYMGGHWIKAKVRGTPHNSGKGIEMALKLGAKLNGNMEGAHAVPMDADMPNYGNLEIPHMERKQYRKICYFLGVMLNKEGKRFVDEGINFRNYTYAQFGRAILNQPNQIAWEIFDAKVDPLLYSEYKFWDASFIEADSIEELIQNIDGIDKSKALETINKFNSAVMDVPFDPTILDGKGTNDLDLAKSNWANKIDTPPFKAYPVTCGITFTYGGVLVDDNARVLNQDEMKINGLYACGEMVGGVFYGGYPGGSGLTSGAVFGRLAGYAAATDEN